MFDLTEQLVGDIKNLTISCPECSCMEDEDYQCNTCNCSGGDNVIYVYKYIFENIKLFKEQK